MEPTVPLAIGVIALVFLALGAIADDRRARVRRRVEIAADPPLIHSINDDRCIGCEACVDVCPTEVLELVDHKVRVIRFSDCVQCEQCANACPTTALVMHREGFTPQTLTVPELDDHFQTGVPGQYLIGEVAGKPLVKNAANLGRAVVEHITRTYSNRPPQGVLDVAIVGSGPGGLSAGLTCLRNKLSCVVLEKEHMLASTVSRYPKGKLFMAEPVDSGNVSYLPVFDASKEELVGAWQKVVDGAKLPVKLGEAVESVKRDDDGLFTIKSTVANYRARSVVLATGLRGKPRLLAVPGANLEKVKSRLDDPDELAGKHVLVVGGGDSAVEGAMSLADAGATVALSYRGDGFKRCKGANQKRLAEMSAAGKLAVLLESNVKEFTPDTVSIALKSGEVSTMPNHAAFVLIGADTPVAWLEANGVRFIEREHLYALGSTEATVRMLVSDATECPKTPDEALARLLGKEPARPSHKRLRSVVSHIGGEFRDAVTNVTGIFKLSTFEEPEPRRSTVGRRTGASKVVPTERLVRRAPPPPPAPKLFAAPRAHDLLLDPPQAYDPKENPFEPEKTAELHAYRRTSAAARAAKVRRQRSVVGEITEDMASLPARMLARSRDFSTEVSRITPLPGVKALRDTNTDVRAAFDGETRVAPPPIDDAKSFDTAFDDSDVREVFEARTRVEPAPEIRTPPPAPLKPAPLRSTPLNPFTDMRDTDVADAIDAIDAHDPPASRSTVANDTVETPSIKNASPPAPLRSIPRPVRAQTVGRGSAGPHTALAPAPQVALPRMPTRVPVAPAPAAPPARAPRGTNVPMPPPIPRRPPPIPHVPKKGGS